MSADNGIYILKSKDGYRVTEAQAIENIYWWDTCCDNPDIREEHCDVEGADILINRCQNCQKGNPPSKRKKVICPERLKEIFVNCDVWPDEEGAFKEAARLYREILDDLGLGIVEYGIQVITYNKRFPR